MQELTAVFERAGYLEVRTYIQSGNVVFKSARGRASEHSSQITQLIGERFGFAPHVMVISGSELAKAVRENPFKDAHRDHRCLHLFFLSEVPTNPELDSLTRCKRGREDFALKSCVFYLYTADGFAQSALRSRFERCLGVLATGRNWRTVNELLRMLDRQQG